MRTLIIPLAIVGLLATACGSDAEPGAIEPNEASTGTPPTSTPPDTPVPVETDESPLTEAPAPWEIVEVNGVSVIVTSGTRLGWGAFEDDEWTPAITDLQRFDELLPVALSNAGHGNIASSLTRYTRWYSGLVIGDQRWVYAYFACGEPLDGGSLTKIPFTDGGGDCYFEARFDIENDSITRIMVNGPD